MTSNPDPLISVILPVYNGEKYIEETIASVLNQSYQFLELIVVDDGSEDGTATIVHSLADTRIKYCFQANQGQSAAINLGTSKAQGTILCFIDADDLWSKDKLYEQLKVWRTNPEGLIFTYIKQFQSPDMDAGDKVIPETPQPGFSRCTMMVAKSQWEKIGDFSTNLKLGEFIEWYSRAKEQGLSHHMIPKVLAFRRIHQHNISSTQADHRSDFVKIMKQRIDQKRKSSTSN